MTHVTVALTQRSVLQIKRFVCVCVFVGGGVIRDDRVFFMSIINLELGLISSEKENSDWFFLA